MQIDPKASIVVLTGAGISKESGLDTFRDADGIWAKVDLEDVATPEAFARDPVLVHGFYNARRQSLLDPAVQPNPAHAALARLEEHWPGGVLVVTQNIDDLHERAGTTRLIHMHGALLEKRCAHCAEVSDCRDELSVEQHCETCGRPGGLRPNVVWFGEMPMQMERIYAALAECGLFLSIGTSGTVYPAAGFVREASLHGTPTVELNMEPSDGVSLFDEAIHGPATTVVPDFVDQLLESRTPG